MQSHYGPPKYYAISLVECRLIYNNLVSMRIFPPQLEISDREGFTPEKDIFGRAKLGEGLSNVVLSVSDPMVIAVDAQWGSGKTTFLKMWASDLRKNGTPVIYFDAFANDYLDDAFIAIASEIISLVEELKSENKTEVDNLIKKATGVGKVLARSSTKLGIKLATLGVLSGTDLDKIASDISKEASQIIDQHIGDLLSTQKEQKASIDAFRSALTELPLLLSSSSENEEVKTKPLIFVIDELDRCRPKFALEVLERIKHLFNVPDVHFILGTHLEQLCSAVRVTYGSEIDAETYLQKFIQLTFFLTDDAEHEHQRVIPKFTKYLIQQLEFKDDNLKSAEAAAIMIEHAAEHKNLSLRSIERIFSTLSLSLAYSNKNHLRIPPILGGLCVLKTTHPKLYLKAKSGHLMFSEIEQNLIQFPGEENHEVNWSVGWWQYCLDKNADENIVQRYSQAVNMFAIRSRFEIVPHIANNIIDKTSFSDNSDKIF